MEKSVKSFSELVNKYDKHLIKFALSFVRTTVIAEELVSDVFYKLWEKRDKVDDIENIEAYLYKATKNHCINYIKSKSGKAELNTETAKNLDFMIDSFNPEEYLIHKELIELMDKVVESLPHSCRVVFKMVKGKGLKQAEVANALGISPKTVENQVAKAIKRLRKAVIEYLNEQSGGDSIYKVLMITLCFYLRFLPDYVGDF